MKKPYEIPASGKGATPKFSDWTKGVSAIARGVPSYGASSNQTFGLPYDPAGVAPVHGGSSAPSSGKRSKPYEIMSGAGSAGHGLRKPVGGGGCGCGCGGGCGGSKGGSLIHSAFSMQEPRKPEGCGCGGKCGGTDPGSSAASRMAALGLVAPQVSYLPQGANILARPSFPSWALRDGAGVGGSTNRLLCNAAYPHIVDLRAQLQEMYAQYGDRLHDLQNAIRHMHAICDSPTDEDNLWRLCNALSVGAAAATDGSTRSTLSALANQCSCSLRHAGKCHGVALYSASSDPETARILGCGTARRQISLIEAQIQNEFGVSLRWHYEIDIAPLEDALAYAERAYSLGCSPPGYAHPVSSPPDPCGVLCALANIPTYLVCARNCNTWNAPASVRGSNASRLAWVRQCGADCTAVAHQQAHDCWTVCAAGAILL